MKTVKSENKKVIEKLEEDKKILKSVVIANVVKYDGKYAKDYPTALRVIQTYHSKGKSVVKSLNFEVKNIDVVDNAIAYINEIDEAVKVLDDTDYFIRVADTKLVSYKEFNEAFKNSDVHSYEINGEFVKLAYVGNYGSCDETCLVTTKHIESI